MPGPLHWVGLLNSTWLHSYPTATRTPSVPVFPSFEVRAMCMGWRKQLNYCLELHPLRTLAIIYGLHLKRLNCQHNAPVCLHDNMIFIYMNIYIRWGSLISNTNASVAKLEFVPSLSIFLCSVFLPVPLVFILTSQSVWIPKQNFLNGSKRTRIHKEAKQKKFISQAKGPHVGSSFFSFADLHNAEIDC